jgi:hypothetical protein
VTPPHRFRRLVAAAAVAALVAVAAPAEALNLRLGDEALRLDVSETLIYAYHLDNLNGTYADDRFHEVQSRLNLGLAYKQWRLVTRVDTALYFDHAFCDDTTGTPVCVHPSPPPASELAWWPPLTVGELRSRYQNRSIDRLGPVYLPERLAIAYSGRRLEVTLGDHYVSLGRGLVLSLRKVDELGSDTDLRGGRVVARLGPFTGTAVAGVTNVVNIDEATGRVSPDPLDVIVGARGEVRFLERFTVATQGAAILYHDKPAGQPDDDRALLGGFSAEGRGLPILRNVYVEYAHAARLLAGTSSGGDAVYGAITHYHGPVTLLLEGKYYAGFPMVQTSLQNPTDSFATITYNNPPTVERVLADLDTVSNLLDVGGGRLRADHRLADRLTWFASYGYFYDWSDPGARLDIHDPYAGVNLAWQEHRSHATLSGGVRLSRERANGDPDYPEHAAETHSLDAHLEVVASQALTSRWSLELSGRHRYRQKRAVLDLNRWHEGEWALGVRWSPSLVVAAGWEYTTDPAKPHPPCGEVGEPVCSTYHQLNFFNGQVAWIFRQGSSVRVFAGGQRGGLRCVSGVCRVFPSFMGVKAEAVVRF